MDITNLYKQGSSDLEVEHYVIKKRFFSFRKQRSSSDTMVYIKHNVPVNEGFKAYVYNLLNDIYCYVVKSKYKNSTTAYMSVFSGTYGAYAHLFDKTEDDLILDVVITIELIKGNYLSFISNRNVNIIESVVHTEDENEFILISYTPSGCYEEALQTFDLIEGDVVFTDVNKMLRAFDSIIGYNYTYIMEDGEIDIVML